MKKKSKHKPQSRINYEKRNPVFSIRMPQVWHDECKKLVKKLGMSRREFMGLSLNKLNANYDKVRAQARKEGHDVGYDKGHGEGYKKGEAVGHKKGFQEGLEKGEKIGEEKAASEWYEKGKKDGRIWYWCWICDKPIFVTPWSDTHTKIMRLLHQFRWGHPECYERLNRERFYPGFY